MKHSWIVLLTLVFVTAAFGGTNSVREVRSRIAPVSPISWGESSMSHVDEESGVTWTESALEVVETEQPLQVSIPVMMMADTQSSATIDQSKITYLCVNPEVAAQMKEVSFFAAQLANGISLSPGFYTLKSVEFQGRSLHWAFAALNPKYCSSLYGIYLEMKSYEKRGLPVPQELYDKMNKAVDFYFFMEEAKARRAERRKK